MFTTALLRNVASSSSSATTATGAQTFSAAHTAYVKSLYRRYLRNSLDWCIRRDVWRDRAIEIRVEFEKHRNVRNPRQLARLFDKAEKELNAVAHPDPHRPPMFEDGTKWERNLPPRMFTEAEKKAALESFH